MKREPLCADIDIDLQVAWLMLDVLRSLALLFRSRYYSLLRLRQEHLSPPLETVLMALVLFAVVLLLFPALLLHAALLAVFDAPRRLVFMATARCTDI